MSKNGYFLNKKIRETIYLNSLLKKYKTKNRVSKIFGIKEFLLGISGQENKATKDKLSKDWHKRLNKLAKSEKGNLRKNK